MSGQKNMYSEIFEQLDNYDDSEGIVSGNDGLTDEEEKELEELMNEYSEGRDYDLSEILEEDDRLLEELVDRVTYLNFVEANTGGDLKKSDVSAEDIEKAYLAVIDSFFELSKIINPTAGFGRGRLEAGLSLIKIFEERFWPLSTVITKGNIEAIEDYLTSEYRDDIIAGKKQAIGALRHAGEDMCAAGAIVYTVNRPTEEYPLSLSLDYIMVDWRVRAGGIGNFLIAELLEQVLQNEGAELFVSMPVITDMNDEEREAHAVIENFLDSWGFTFTVINSMDFVIKITESKKNKLVNRKQKKAISLYNLGGKGPSLLKDFFKRNNNEYDADLAMLPYEFFDEDVSCAILDKKGIRSVLLFHRLDNGNYRYEAIRCDEEHAEEDMHDLISCAYKTCVSFGDDDKMLFGTFDSLEAMETAKKLSPEGRMLMKYKGVLTPPDPDGVITTEAWDELREDAGLSNYKMPDKGLDDDGIGSKELDMIKDYIRKYSE